MNIRDALRLASKENGGVLALEILENQRFGELESRYSATEFTGTYCLTRRGTCLIFETKVGAGLRIGLGTPRPRNKCDQMQQATGYRFGKIYTAEAALLKQVTDPNELVKIKNTFTSHKYPVNWALRLEDLGRLPSGRVVVINPDACPLRNRILFRYIAMADGYEIAENGGSGTREGLLEAASQNDYYPDLDLIENGCEELAIAINLKNGDILGHGDAKIVRENFPQAEIISKKDWSPSALDLLNRAIAYGKGYEFDAMDLYFRHKVGIDYDIPRPMQFHGCMTSLRKGLGDPYEEAHAPRMLQAIGLIPKDEARLALYRKYIGLWLELPQGFINNVHGGIGYKNPGEFAKEAFDRILKDPETYTVKPHVKGEYTATLDDFKTKSTSNLSGALRYLNALLCGVSLPGPWSPKKAIGQVNVLAHRLELGPHGNIRFRNKEEDWAKEMDSTALKISQEMDVLVAKVRPKPIFAKGFALINPEEIEETPKDTRVLYMPWYEAAPEANPPSSLVAKAATAIRNLAANELNLKKIKWSTHALSDLSLLIQTRLFQTNEYGQIIINPKNQEAFENLPGHEAIAEEIENALRNSETSILEPRKNFVRISRALYDDLSENPSRYDPDERRALSQETQLQEIKNRETLNELFKFEKIEEVIRAIPYTLSDLEVRDLHLYLERNGTTRQNYTKWDCIMAILENMRLLSFLVPYHLEAIPMFKKWEDLLPVALEYMPDHYRNILGDLPEELAAAKTFDDKLDVYIELHARIAGTERASAFPFAAAQALTRKSAA